MKNFLFLKKALTACAFFSFFFVNSLQAQTAYKEIRQQLHLLVQQKKLSSQDVQNWKVSSTNFSERSQVEHVYFKQSHNGYEILNTVSDIHVTKNGKVIAFHSNFVHNLPSKLLVQEPILNAEQAILAFAGIENRRYSQLNLVTSDVQRQYVYQDDILSSELIPIKFVYYAIPDSKIVPAWNFSVRDIDGIDWWSVTINALNGEILEKVNWTNHCITAEMHTEHGHQHITPLPENRNTIYTDAVDGTYNVFPMPYESPYDGDRVVVEDPFNIIASPYGWHDLNGEAGADSFVTSGNNVSAFDGGDHYGFQPDGGSELIFDFPFNPVYSSSDQSESAILTNLFYWNNIMHDVLYQYGFDEASGNFQNNNYGNGGLANDYVQASGQDGSGTCNAYFSTPPDGGSGFMAMFTCGSRDSSVDNGVVAHEYTHGLTNRLTGGADQASCLRNDEQMGEGWSDWYAIMLTIKSTDTRDTVRPMGNYFVGNDEDGPGIRDYPYSTNMSVDPRTYQSIYGLSGVHPIGSVWAAMLWEMTWNLIDEYGFDEDFYNGTGGNNMALALVTEALKIQPCSPGFVDGRDAILAADIALYDGANQCLIWEAFAKRGLGFSADQGSSFSTTDGVEAFDLPETTLNLDNATVCLSNGVITLGGGIPAGGVYSGPGVTDDGNGTTFTFDPNAVGVGNFTITYTAESLCSTIPEDDAVIQVIDEGAVPICQDVDIYLGEDGTYQIQPTDVVTNIIPEGYNVDQEGTFNPASITGTSVSLGDDTVSGALPIGFNFNFFENEYDQFYISSNGFITFSDGSDSGCCSGQSLPYTSAPNNLIAFAWDDLNPSSGGTVRYETIGSAPTRVLVVEFNNVPFYSSSNTVTSQVKLFENSNRIEIHSTSIASSGGMTQGIENIDGTDAQFLEGRNASTWSATEDYVAFYSAGGNTIPDNCGGFATVTLDVETFGCENLGENTVTATAIDSAGNETFCTSTVTVYGFETEPQFNISEQICENQTTTLGGAIPVGGVYSGEGVTDDGNGETFTFDATNLEIGTYTIAYTVETGCGVEETIETQIEVISSLPELTCTDIEINLDENGFATIDYHQLLNVNDSVYLYGLKPFENVIYRNIFNPETYEIVADETYQMTTDLSLGRPLAMDYNFVNNTYYILHRESTDVRNLYSFDPETGEEEFVSQITSTQGDGRVQDMTFDNSGTLYFKFKNGEINAFDLQDFSTSFVAELTENTSPPNGLTYDNQNDRLIISAAAGTVEFFEIDLSDNSIQSLFETTDLACHAQGIEYIGNDQLLSSSTAGCNQFSVIDLTTQNITPLAFSTNTDNVKDLMFINNTLTSNCGETLEVSLSMSEFTCEDLGENEVLITVSDAAGNSTSCTSTVTVVWDNSQEPVIENCPEDYTVYVDETYTLPDFLDEINVTDDCSYGLNVTQTPVSGTIININSVIPVVITVTDNTGNEVNCIFNVTVEESMGVADVEELSKDILLYPNPTRNQFTIKYSGVYEISGIEMYDSSGKLVKTQPLNTSNDEFNVDVSGFTTGSYIVKIITEKGTIIKKLIIK